MERVRLSDGSMVYDQGAIGPSDFDRDFFNDPSRPTHPLRHFPGRGAMAPAAIIGTSAIVAGCVQFGAPQPQEVRDVSEFGLTPSPQTAELTPGQTFEEHDPNNPYCRINLDPNNPYGNKDPIGLRVDFSEPSDPDSQHRVLIIGQITETIENPSRTQYSTAELEAGIRLTDPRYDSGNYVINVIENAVNSPFEDEGRTCSSGIYIDIDGNGKPEPSTLPVFAEGIADVFIQENIGVHGRPVILRFLDTLNISEEAIKTYENTQELFEHPTSLTGESFRRILNNGRHKPRKGDILVIKPSEAFPNGNLAINRSWWVDNEGRRHARALTPLGAMEDVSLDETYGWLRAKLLDSPFYDLLEIYYEERLKNIEDIENYDYNNEGSLSLAIWLDILGIPEELGIQNMSWQELSSNPNEALGQFFEVIPNRWDVRPRYGDIFWDEYGPAVITEIGVESNGEIYVMLDFNISVSNINYDGRDYVLLRPILSTNVESAATTPQPSSGEVLEPSLAPESTFAPDNPEQFARYHLANQWVENYLTSSRSLSDWNTRQEKWMIVSGVKMSDEEKEKLKRDLAEGKGAGPISFYYYSIDLEHMSTEGDTFVVPMRVIIAEAEGISLESDGNEGENMFDDSAYKGVFGGKFKFSAEKIRYGVADLIIKATQESGASLEITGDYVNFDFIGFDRITNFSPWQSGESELVANIGKDGTVWCGSDLPDLPVSGNLEHCLNVGWDENGQLLADMGLLTQFGITESDMLNSEGYNGEFVIEPF